MNFRSHKKYFITGIDTGVGKTVVTGLIAKRLKRSGVLAITQKLAQTGCKGISEDILKHRQIAETDILEEDRDFTTCPYVFEYPASPHLSAELEGKTIDISLINANTAKLLENYEVVLIEGAGGLFVPITRDYFTINYIVDQKLPVILVTTPKLGSINHTLLTLNACIARNIEVSALVYNQYLASPIEITNDSKSIFKKYLSENLPNTEFIEMEELY